MKISNKEEAVKHFIKVMQLEKASLKVKASFLSHHPSRGSYYVITIEPQLFYVRGNGEVTSEFPA